MKPSTPDLTSLDECETKNKDGRLLVGPVDLDPESKEQ